MPNQTRNLKIIEMRKRGIGPREVARQLGVSANVVNGVLHRAGLTVMARGRGNGATEEFKRMALNRLSSATWRETAKEYGVSTGALNYWSRQEK